MVRIRNARIEDVERIVSIQKEVTGVQPGASWRMYLERRIKDGNSVCLVALADGDIAGFIVGCIREWLFGIERAAWVEMLAVRPSHMGAGIGHDLGRTLVRRLASRNVSEVRTVVRWDAEDMLSYFRGLGMGPGDLLALKMLSRRGKAQRRA